MHLDAGVAYVPRSEAISAIVTRYRKQLEEYLSVRTAIIFCFISFLVFFNLCRKQPSGLPM